MEYRLIKWLPYITGNKWHVYIWCPKPKQIYIIIGFSSQLTGWWEWGIGEKGQQEILNAVKIINSATHTTFCNEILDIKRQEINKEEQDCGFTLIYIIWDMDI